MRGGDGLQGEVASHPSLRHRQMLTSSYEGLGPGQSGGQTTHQLQTPVREPQQVVELRPPPLPSSRSLAARLGHAVGSRDYFWPTEPQRM